MHVTQISLVGGSHLKKNFFFHRSNPRNSRKDESDGMRQKPDKMSDPRISRNVSSDGMWVGPR